MKERTLRGPHKGKRLIIGYEGNKVITATVWDDMLLLARNNLPTPYVKRMSSLYLIGGKFWREVPHNFVKNPLNLMLYPDTLCTKLVSPVGMYLIPGYKPKGKIQSWLSKLSHKLVLWVERHYA